MSLHRTVHLLGFKQPTVKGDTITLDVACGAGECLNMAITRQLWSQMNAAVAVAAREKPAGLPILKGSSIPTL